MKRIQQTLLVRLSQLTGVSVRDGAFVVARPSGASPLLTPSLPTHGTSSVEKPHAFVAMPFAPEFEDIFHYGLQAPIHQAGLLCELATMVIVEGAQGQIACNAGSVDEDRVGGRFLSCSATRKSPCAFSLLRFARPSARSLCRREAVQGSP